MDRLISPIPPLLDVAQGVGPFLLPKEPVQLHQFWAFRDIAGDVPTMPVVSLQVLALGVLDPFVELLTRHGFPAPGRLPRNRSQVRSAQEVRSLMRMLRLGFQENPQLRSRLLDALSRQEDIRWSQDERRLMTALVNLYGGNDTYYFNFYGEPATFPFISYDRARKAGTPKNLEDPLDLEGKVVFVGMAEYSSTEQLDAFYTVYRRSDGVDLAGVEIAATAFSNLLNDQVLVRRLALNHGFLLLFGGLVGFLAIRLSGLRAIAAASGAGAVYFGLALFLFMNHRIWIPVALPLYFQLPGALFFGLLLQYWETRRERERLRKFVPNSAQQEVFTGQRFATCLLTDIQGSKNLSSRLGPVEYDSLMGKYFDTVTPPIIQHEGRIRDFVGDAVMSVFMAEKPQKSVRQNACQAALEILAELDLFNRDQSEEQQAPTRIGLHTDWIVYGRTVGDAGNTASSIEGLNKLLSTRILASEDTVFDLDEFLFRGVGSFILPGKDHSLDIVEVMGLRTGAEESQLELCARFSDVLKAFESENWPRTAQLCQEILSDFPDDGPAHFFLDLSNCYRHAKPPSNPTLIQIGSDLDSNLKTGRTHLESPP